MGSMFSKVKDFFSSIFNGGIFGKIKDFFSSIFNGGIFKKIKDYIISIFEIFLDPVFWFVCISYSIIFTYIDNYDEDNIITNIPNWVIPTISGILGFAYIFTRKCKKITYNQLLMGLSMYIIHRIANLILGFIPFIRMLAMVPIIGTFALCILSLYPGILWTSILYSCDKDAKSLFK